MQARWKARDNRASRHVTDHHRAPSDQCALSNLDSAHHDRTASDRRAFAHHSVFHLPVLLRMQPPVAAGRARAADIDEDDAVADEDFALDGAPGAYERVMRDFAATPDFRIALN